MTIKTLAAGAAGIALAAAPVFALAHDDNRDANMKQPIADKTTVSVAIANNGSTLVRGAKVTDVNGDTVTATTVANGVTLTWTIDTDGDTDFVDVSSDGIARGDIDDGDYVSFSGALTGSLRVDADTVRDWSQGEAKNDHGFWTSFSARFPFFSFMGHAKGDK